MSSEQNSAPEVSVDQPALIGSLSQQELADLDTQLFPLPPEEPKDWAALVRRERLQREAAISVELSSFSRGFPTCTDYDWRDANAYLQDARALMLSANLTHFEYRHPGATIARRVAYRCASTYLLDHRLMAWRDFEIPKDDLKHFLGKNLLYVMSVARTIADREYFAERSSIITTYLPDLVWQDKESIQASMDKAKITRSGVESAREAIGKISYSAPLPDFFNLEQYMSPDEAETARTEVTSIVGQELYELCELMQEIDPGLLRIRANRTGALGYLSVHELRMSINTNDVPSVDICKAFLRSPRMFRQKLAALQVKGQTGSDAEIPELGVMDLSTMQIPNLDAE